LTIGGFRIVSDALVSLLSFSTRRTVICCWGWARLVSDS